MYAVFLVLLLSMVLRFIHVTAHVGSLFLCITEYYTVWVQSSLFI